MLLMTGNGVVLDDIYATLDDDAVVNGVIEGEGGGYTVCK